MMRRFTGWHWGMIMLLVGILAYVSPGHTAQNRDNTIASPVKPSKRLLARAIQWTESTAGLYLTVEKDDGGVFVTTHHCCSQAGCTGPVPSNSTCVGGFLLKCQHSIEVNGEDVPIPPLCSPAP